MQAVATNLKTINGLRVTPYIADQINVPQAIIEAPHTGGAGGFRTVGGTAFFTTLSTVTLDYFLFDGTNWRLWTRITGQTI